MKSFFYLIIILIINSSFIATSEGELVVEVTGLDVSKKGNLRIGVFKKNGFPDADPYGFSNNKFGKFGPPDFNDVSFSLKSGQSLFLKISLK